MNGQDELNFDAVSAPVDETTRATLQLISHDWHAEADWTRFTEACQTAADNDGVVDPNEVRTNLTNAYGLTIEPRRYSAFWSRAKSKTGFLDPHGWTTNADHAGGNAGKPARTYRLRSSAEVIV